MLSNTIQAPCKDCPDRKLACHDTCEKYIKYSTELKALNDKIKEGRNQHGVAKKAMLFSHTSNVLSNRSHIK